MTAPRALIFDLDGTLCDTRADLANAVNYARAQFDLDPLSVNEITSYVGDGTLKMLERSFHGCLDMAEAALPHYGEHYAAHLADGSPLYEGVAAGVLTLADAGALMAVLTNKPEGFARELLDHHGLTRFMRHVFGGDTFATRKPDPEGALALIESFGVTPSETLMIGDNHTDLRTAHNAGMPAAFCAYGFGRQDGAPCDVTIESFGKIVEIFQGAA